MRANFSVALAPTPLAAQQPRLALDNDPLLRSPVVSLGTSVEGCGAPGPPAQSVTASFLSAPPRITLRQDGDNSIAADEWEHHR
jgi:hypothetical protein